MEPPPILMEPTLAPEKVPTGGTGDKDGGLPDPLGEEKAAEKGGDGTAVAGLVPLSCASLPLLPSKAPLLLLLPAMPDDVDAPPPPPPPLPAPPLPLPTIGVPKLESKELPPRP